LNGKHNWTMSNVLVEYSTAWRAEQPLPADPNAEVQTYDRVASYRFGVRRSALA
jgi:hypothetical protein